MGIKRDGSIRCQQKTNGRIGCASDAHSVELVSPILTYHADIDTLQQLIRGLRRAGGFTNSSAGIHIHLDGAPHTPRSIRNFVNIIASKNDLFYKALQIEEDRMRYCKKMDAALVEKMNRRKPQTFEHIERIWYEGYRENAYGHYHSSRYHFLNLHSFFRGHHTVELRGFNSELHAGKVQFTVLGIEENLIVSKIKTAKSLQQVIFGREPNIPPGFTTATVSLALCGEKRKRGLRAHIPSI